MSIVQKTIDELNLLDAKINSFEIIMKALEKGDEVLNPTTVRHICYSIRDEVGLARKNIEDYLLREAVNDNKKTQYYE